MANLICESQVRKFILERIKANRPALKFTRVSEKALKALDIHLRLHIVKCIDRHTSVGKTFVEVL